MTRTQLQKIRHIQPLVEQIVEHKLRELLGDPDSGLTLKRAIRQRLHKSLHAKGATIPATHVARELGLRW